MRYEKPEIHTYRFITGIETTASTIETVKQDIHAAISANNAARSESNKATEQQAIFSFEF